MDWPIFGNSDSLFLHNAIRMIKQIILSNKTVHESVLLRWINVYLSVYLFYSEIPTNPKSQVFTDEL